MNYRESVLVAAQALNRIRASKAARKAATSKKYGQNEEIAETAPASVQEDKAPAPAKHRGLHAEIIIKRPRSPQKVV